MINKNEAKLEISMIFVQPSSRLMYFLMGWLLVLGLKDCLVKCATVCVRSMVILTYPYPKGEHMGAVGAQICEFYLFTFIHMDMHMDGA